MQLQLVEPKLALVPLQEPQQVLGQEQALGQEQQQDLSPLEQAAPLGALPQARC